VKAPAEATWCYAGRARASEGSGGDVVWWAVGKAAALVGSSVPPPQIPRATRTAASHPHPPTRTLDSPSLRLPLPDRAFPGAGLPASPDMAPIETADVPDDAAAGDSFTVLKQTLDLDFSFNPRRVTGTTTLEIQPKKPQLREIILNCRQLTPTRIRLEDHTAAFSYANLHQRLTLYPGTGLEQYHYPKERIARHVDDRSEDELVIFVPDNVQIREVRPEEVGEEENAPGVFYASLKLHIEYVLDDFRDALHFVGVEDGDARFPHAYTRNSPFPGTASCLFPCIDDGVKKCLFDVSVRYPRTLRDALSKAPPRAPTAAGGPPPANGTDKADSVMADADDDQLDLSEEEKAMEMAVICSGALTDDVSGQK
jgi:transcription initiation factor TFIID subunit 2